MENENFSAPKANDPLIGQNASVPQQHVIKVAIVEEDEAKKFLPKGDGDGVHYKKDFGQVEIKQPPKFIGLTQEELQKYADDPFWRKLRLALFILFWLSWIAMFAIAIVLVVTSKKCPPKPDRQWWQNQVCYQAYSRTFMDSDHDGVGDFKGIKEKVYDLSRSHVKTIWPVPVLNSTEFTGYDVVNFTDVDPRLGKLDDFVDVIKASHDYNMFVVIDLPVSTMSVESNWFQESASRSDGPYAHHFHWRSVSGTNDTDKTWYLNKKRSQFYWTYTANHWPLLNWGAPDLLTDMKNVLRTWLNRGVDGFYLGHVELMGLTSNGEFSIAQVTKGIQALKSAIQSYKNESGNTKEIALFTSLNESNDHIHELRELLSGEGGINYLINSNLVNVNASCDAKCIRDQVVKGYNSNTSNGRNSSWPAWEIGNPYESRVATRLNNNREQVELLQMLLFMLEGSINTYYGDELGIVNVDPREINVSAPHRFVMRSPMQWDDSHNAGFSTNASIEIPVNKDYATNNLKAALAKGASAAKLYKKMAEWRMNDESFLYEQMEVAPPHDSLVGIKRKSYYNSPNYFAVMNFANKTLEKVDLTKELALTIPEKSEPTIGIVTSNLAGTLKSRDTIDVTAVTLPPYSGIVIKYKPA